MKAINIKMRKILSIVICLGLVISYAPMASIIARAADDHICVDNDEDHWCDICDSLTPCVDKNNDCECELCYSTMLCRDADDNHICDSCGQLAHLDDNSDQKCDVCGKCVIICFDEDITLTADASGNKYFNGIKYTGELIIYNPDVRGYTRLYITIESGEHTVILSKAHLANLTVKSGAKLNLTIEGVCEITGNIRKFDTAVKVEENAELLITSASTGTLTATGGYNHGLFAGGKVTIEGGNIDFSAKGDRTRYYSGVAVTGELIITGGNILFKSDYGSAVSGNTVTDVANSVKLDPKKCCGFGIKETEASEEIIGSFDSLTSIEELVSGDKYKSLYIYELEHTFQNGFCVKCDNNAYEPAKLNSKGYYEIQNGGNLYWFAEKINNGGEDERYINAILMNDIDLEGKADGSGRVWTPIGVEGGTSAQSYRGIFDGNGKTITGLYVNAQRNALGLFGEVRDGTVKNFTVYGDVMLNGKHDYVGGVIGSTCGTANDKGATVSGITSYVNVTLGEGSQGSNRVAGLVGYVNHNTLVENCTWYGKLDLGPYRAQDGVGGLIGRANGQYRGTIRNCAAYGTIETSYKSGSFNNGSTAFDTIYIGGIISNSVADAQPTIENCIWAGTLINNTDLGEKAHISAIGTLNGLKSLTNCYYLENSTPYVTTNNYNATGNISVNAQQLASGKIAYKLGSAWGQKIGTDLLPVVGGEKVYYVANSCPEYTNVNEFKEHCKFDKNGFCVDCGGYQEAELSDNVYHIKNAGNLFWFANQINNDNIFENTNAVLLKNIDLDGRVWTPICSTASYHLAEITDIGYSGTFDGKGYTISDFIVECEYGDGSSGETGNVKSYGLFGTVSGKIKNLGVDGFFFDSTDLGKADCRVGAIAGQLLEDGRIENCFAINSEILTGKRIAGGIAGCNYGGTIENCFAYNNEVTGHARCAAIVGDTVTDANAPVVYTGYVINCYADKAPVGSQSGGEDFVMNCEEKTAEQFASGNVAYLLGDAWGQMSNVEGSLPVLTDNELYKVVTVGDGYSVSNIGDTNSDGTVDVIDYQALINTILADEHEQLGTTSYDDIIRYDLDGDGYLDVIDAALMHNFINGFIAIDIYTVGDYDCNGKAFEEADINAIKVAIESPEGLSTAQKHASDIDGDGKISKKDLAELSRLFEGKYHVSCEFTAEFNYSWADDYSTCTATAICTVCDEAFATEEVDVTSAVLVEKTCTQDGEIKYTATFENELFEEQVKNITVKHGHVLTAYKDNGDGSHSKDCVECNYTEADCQYHIFDDNGNCPCGYKATPISTLEELVAAAAQGGEFVLMDDINVTQTNLGIRITADVTLNMNGKTVNNLLSNVFIVSDYNTLNLYGEGIVLGENTAVAVALFIATNGSANINGTTISGHINMKGINLTISSGFVDVIQGNAGICNIMGGTVDTIYSNGADYVITGGTFEQDVSKYVDTEKYTVKKNADGTYTVIANES